MDVLDFRSVALFRNQTASNVIDVENWAKISHLLPPPENLGEDRQTEYILHELHTT